MDIKINSFTNFKSGLTPKILRMEKNINPKQVEDYFYNLPTKDYGSFCFTDLKNNKAMATANRLCADIFNNMRKLFDYRNYRTIQTLTSPQDLYVYNKKDSNFYEGLCFFNIADIVKTEIDKPHFLIGTVFMPNDIDELEYLDACMEETYQKNIINTPHFLSTIVHEWVHAIFCKTLYSICDNRDLDYYKTIEDHHSKKLSNKEKEIVSDIIGTCAATSKKNQYSEVFADSWAKFICESLADDCRTFKKNPLDLMRATPKEFQEILKKVSNVEFVKFL